MLDVSGCTACGGELLLLQAGNNPLGKDQGTAAI